MTRKNPLVKGRMYKVKDGGRIKGIRFNKNGTTDVLVVPGAKKRNPKKRKARRNATGKGKQAGWRHGRLGRTVRRAAEKLKAKGKLNRKKRAPKKK
jgi:hypothetical protein